MHHVAAEQASPAVQSGAQYEPLVRKLLFCRTRAQPRLLAHSLEALLPAPTSQWTWQRGPSGVTAVRAAAEVALMCHELLFGCCPPWHGAVIATVCVHRGSISFQNVHVRYSPAGQAALEGLDLRIGAGEKVGICGRTGTLKGLEGF